MISKNKIDNPIIFIGSGRSGSTLIFEVISKHPDLAWPPNYTSIYPSLPVEINLTRKLFHNKFWNLNGQKKQLNKVSFLNSIAFKPGENSKLWNKLSSPDVNFRRDFLLNYTADIKEQKRIRKYFEKVVSYQGKKRLTFKLTGPSKIGYMRSIFPNAIFVHIVREPLATINSWLNVDFWKERGMHQLWWQGAYSEKEKEWAVVHKDKPALLAALQYKKLMDVTEVEVKKNNVEYLQVKYEDFIKEPVKVIDAILQFSHLEHADAIDKYLSEIKIYDRSKNYEAMFDANDLTDMNKILNGTYTY